MVNFPKYNKQAKRSGTPPPPPQPKPTPPPPQPYQPNPNGYAFSRIINPDRLPLSRAPAPPGTPIPDVSKLNAKYQADRQAVANARLKTPAEWQQEAMQVMANYDAARQRAAAANQQYASTTGWSDGPFDPRKDFLHPHADVYELPYGLQNPAYSIQMDRYVRDRRFIGERGPRPGARYQQPVLQNAVRVPQYQPALRVPRNPKENDRR